MTRRHVTGWALIERHPIAKFIPGSPLGAVFASAVTLSAQVLVALYAGVPDSAFGGSESGDEFFASSAVPTALAMISLTHSAINPRYP